MMARGAALRRSYNRRIPRLVGLALPKLAGQVGVQVVLAAEVVSQTLRGALYDWAVLGWPGLAKDQLCPGCLLGAGPAVICQECQQVGRLLGSVVACLHRHMVPAVPEWPLHGWC